MLWLILACAPRVPSRGLTIHSSADDTGSPPAPFTLYLHGSSQVSSPDGSSAYGPADDVLVRRTSTPAQGQIVEETWYSGEAGRTTLVRQGDTTVFDASDAAGTFTGTLSFDGPEWDWNHWTYDIVLTDGSGSLVGEGTWDGAAWQSVKTFSDADGNAVARIQDDLAGVDQASFDALLAEL